MNKSAFQWPGPGFINFIHNWRCAGSTLNSILSSNFQSNYLKIGHPFNAFGWPENYSDHSEPILTLGQLRSLMSKMPSSQFLIGGHSFLGLESFLTGPSDIWMNYRDPLDRLNSGIIRFYSRQYKTIDSSKHLHGSSSGSPPIDITSSSSINQLLQSNLLRESNGMSRRLAALSLSQDFCIQNSDNIETLDMLTKTQYQTSELQESAISNLSKIKVLINSKYLQVSLLCIEKIYNLNSPLINPFSDLHHNPLTLSGAPKNSTILIDNCKNILMQHTEADRALFPIMNRIFANQVNSCSIDDKQVLVRELIHKSPLFKAKWFLKEYNSDEVRLVAHISESIYNLCFVNKSFSQEIIDTILSWHVISPNIRLKVSKCLSDKYSLRSKII